MLEFTLNPLEDKLKEECGIFGIHNHESSAVFTSLGLHALQHRGQEAVGIVSVNDGNFVVEHHEGLVGDNFSTSSVLNKMAGNAAIGHVRYSTAGGGGKRNIQPIFAELNFGGIAIAHNGNLTNAETLRKLLIERGCIFQSNMDTEVIIHLIATNRQEKFVDRVVEALKSIEGAYSLIIQSANQMIAVRDNFGIRPLVLGKVDNAYVVCSETCALDIIGAEFVRDVKPGEMIIIEGENLTSLQPFNNNISKFCIFEYIYFSRPDSLVEGRDVYQVRKQIGYELAKESFVEADLVVPVPDSGVASAIGYASYNNVPFELGIIRNHYVGRTFIEPIDQVRKMGVKLKHNANSSVLKGKKVVLVDDSIVRGTTSQKIVKMVREAGAKEIHMRISSPPTIRSCYYGVDTPDESKLLAANYSVEEMQKLLNVDSLAFISIDGLYRAMGEAGRNNLLPQFCDACFTGEYPVSLTDKKNRLLKL